MRTFQTTTRRDVAGVTFGMNDSLLLAGGSGGFDIWELTGGVQRFVPFHSSKYLYSFHTAPQGRTLYYSMSLTGLHLFDLPSLDHRQLPGNQYDQHVISLSVSPSGDRLVVSRGGAGRNRIECWAIDPESGTLLPGWALRCGELCSPDGPFYFAQANEEEAFTYEVCFDTTGASLFADVERRGHAKTAPTIQKIDSATGEVIGELTELRAGFRVQLLSVRDDRLITWSEWHIDLWDPIAGKKIAGNNGHGRAHIRDAAIHPSRQFFATVGGDGQVRYWSVDDLAPMRSFSWGIGKLHSIAFNAEGTLAAAGGAKGQVILWDVDL